MSSVDQNQGAKLRPRRVRYKTAGFGIKDIQELIPVLSPARLTSVHGGPVSCKPGVGQVTSWLQRGVGLTQRSGRDPTQWLCGVQSISASTGSPGDGRSGNRHCVEP